MGWKDAQNVQLQMIPLDYLLLLFPNEYTRVHWPKNIR